MTEIIVAVISSVAVLGAAILALGGRYLGTMRAAVARLDKRVEKLDEKTERVRSQVENSHQTNLREELDERHTETRRWFDRASDAIDETRRDLGGIRSELRLLRTRDDGLDERVQRIESTTNRILKEKP